ncbi:MAG: hypothetical protein HQ402_00075 [Parcubacteria group bacterium]|nr:hypothetical protein [Parcubacteria group bacterium]
MPGAQPSLPQSDSNILPFGAGPQNTNTPNTNGGQGGTIGTSTISGGENTVMSPEQILSLRQISNTPTAGATTFDTKTATFIRYVDRAVGHIYDVDTQTWATIKISNTTIPKIYDTLWVNNGSGLIMRYLDETGSIQNFYTDIKKPTNVATSTNQTPTQLEGVFLPSNINEMATSPKTDRFVYFTNTNTNATGIISNLDGKKRTPIFSSPFTEWLVSWPKEGIVTLTTKPSSNVVGIMYFLNTINGNLNKIIGDVPGLTTLTNSDASKVLYSGNRSNNIELNIYTIEDDSNRLAGLSTLPEKCVWSKKDTDIVYCGVPKVTPSGSYPDLWYQGVVSFNDDLWKIDTKTGTTEIIAHIKDLSETEMDVSKPFLTTKEDFFIFINKKDLTLWSFDLNSLNVR